jgi:hypothetical protein
VKIVVVPVRPGRAAQVGLQLPGVEEEGTEVGGPVGISFGLVTTGVRPQVKQRVTSPPPPVPPLTLTLAAEDAEDDV